MDCSIEDLYTKTMSWKQYYPDEEQKQSVLKGYEETRAANPLFRFISTKWGYQLLLVTAIVWLSYLMSVYFFEFHADIWLKLFGGIVLMVTEMLVTHILFCYLHVIVHILMLFPDAWSKKDVQVGNRRIIKTPVTYHAYYHHFSTRSDNWHPMLGVGRVDAVRATNAAHIHNFTQFTRPLSLLLALFLVNHFPMLAIFYFGMDLGGLLIGPAHIYQHDNDHWQNRVSGKLCRFMQLIGVFTDPRYHKIHHKYKSNPFVFSSFTSSGILHPIFPFLEKHFDRIYDRAFENKNDKPYINVMVSNPHIAILNVIFGKAASDALLILLFNPILNLRKNKYA